MNPPEIRFDPDTGRIAIKTQLGDIRAWFVFNTLNGGHYTPGTRTPDDVSDWQTLVEPESST